MIWKKWINKKVYVIVQTGNSKKYYEGNVLEVEYLGDDDNKISNYLITMEDKFGDMVCFSNKEILLIQEEK